MITISNKKTIGIIATLDTRGDEAYFLKKQIETKGYKTITIDAGVIGPPYYVAEITREKVAEAGGKSLRQVAKMSRGSSTAVMIIGVSNIVIDLYKSGKLDGLIGLGGGTGARLCTSCMKELPIGVPKLLVCTYPKAEHFGIKDITIMHSVVDLVGLNSIIKKILTNAANAITAMANEGCEVKVGTKPTVGITCWGVVTISAMNIMSLLEKNGYEPILFHGKTGALEDMINKGLINSVIDLCPQELIALYINPEVLKTGLEARADRLESVGRKGLPCIFTPGTLDGTFFPLNNPIYAERKKTEHFPGSYLVRTSKEEMELLGEVVARKANIANGPVAIVIPLEGLSANNREGLELYNIEADMAFINAIEKNVRKNVKVLKIACHINDKIFAKKVVALLDKMFKK